MSWSLQLHDGDFAVRNARLSTVTDQSKLVQDLRCVILTPMGSDQLNRAYGSVIDGGTMPDGTTVAGVLGMTPQQASNLIQSEIQRIAGGYQAQQLVRAKNDRATYNRVSLSSGEVLIAVTGIQFTQQQDTLLVTVNLETAQNQSLTVIFPLQTN